MIEQPKHFLKSQLAPNIFPAAYVQTCGGCNEKSFGNYSISPPYQIFIRGIKGASEKKKGKKTIHPLAFDWPTQKSTSVGLQIQRMENDDELLCISDGQSLHFHIPHNNTCTFLITADYQPGGVKRGLKSQRCLIHGDTRPPGGRLTQWVVKLTRPPAPAAMALVWTLRHFAPWLAVLS